MREQQSHEVADVFRAVVEQKKLRASYEQWKVVNAITKCRTSALGGHLYRCTHCEYSEPRYNSCRNRHCPKCQGGAIAKWLKERESELLPVPYFHTVFTVPHEFNELFLSNKRLMFSVLFSAVAETLREAAYTRYEGEIGFFAVLHTWGQKLEFHPHIHCVIPGVILSENGESRTSPENYFIPDRILSKMFRGIFLKHVERAEGKLSYQEEQSLSELKKKSVTKTWVVYSKKPFAGPTAVLKYLSRYTHRVAISNARIKRFDGERVTFTYKDYSNGAKKKSTSLEASEFTRRFLLHTLPHQFVRIRHFGFMANRKRAESISRVRDALVREPIRTGEEEKPQSRCPKCQQATWSRHRKLNPLSTFPPHTIIPHRPHPPPEEHGARRLRFNSG